MNNHIYIYLHIVDVLMCFFGARFFETVNNMYILILLRDVNYMYVNMPSEVMSRILFFLSYV